MKYLSIRSFPWNPLRLLFPADEGTDDGGGAPDGGNPPGGRPDWCPEKFWNEESNEPRTEVAFKAYTELEGKLRESHDTIRSEVEADLKKEREKRAPDSYEVQLPDDLGVPENVNLSIDKDDPLAQWFFGFAKEQGMTQEEVNAAITEYVKLEMANLPDPNKLVESLGDYGKDRMLKVETALDNLKLPDDQKAALQTVMGTKSGVEALEAVFKTVSAKDFDGDGGGGEQLTLDELKSMQNDVRYWRDKDPAFIKKVQDGYQRLYGDAKIDTTGRS